MKQDFTKVIMNPIRQRVLQYLAVHKSGTTNEIKAELYDVPPASLYRHIKVLLDAGLIIISDQRKVRGTVEKVYQINEKAGAEACEQDIPALVQSSLVSIMATFQKYFAKADADPVKDMLGVTTSTLMLSDEEYMAMLQKIGQIIAEVMNNQPSEERKARRVTFISSPCEDEK